jgi:hypothetical protein
MLCFALFLELQEHVNIKGISLVKIRSHQLKEEDKRLA